MIHVHLDDSTRDELQGLRRQDLPAKVRDRLEMFTLADAGWKPARIAEHLGYSYRAQNWRSCHGPPFEGLSEAENPSVEAPSSILKPVWNQNSPKKTRLYRESGK